MWLFVSPADLFNPHPALARDGNMTSCQRDLKWDVVVRVFVDVDVDVDVNVDVNGSVHVNVCLCECVCVNVHVPCI